MQKCAFVYVILLQGNGCGFCISLLVTVSKYSYREVSIKLVCTFCWLTVYKFVGYSLLFCYETYIAR